MLIFMNLPQDYDWLFVQALESRGHLYNPNEKAVDRYCLWHEIQERFVSPQSYRIFVSQELRKNGKYAQLKNVLQEVKAAFRSGSSLSPYLSSRIPNLGKKGRDYMLQHWHIRHLNLSPISSIDSKGLVKRADDLLFFKVDGDCVYFLDILSHAEPHVFEQKRLLSVVEKNWPQLHGHVQRRGRAMEKTLKPEEMRQLRRHNINTFERIGGRIIAPGMGVSAGGTSLDAVRTYDRHQEELRHLEVRIRARFWEYFSQCNSQGLAHIRLTGLWTYGFDTEELFSGAQIRFKIC